jgi:hypothetical protein
MHRRQDTEQDGVAILEGTRRDTGRDEVITLLFDRKVFLMEERAKMWWDRNKARFLE